MPTRLILGFGNPLRSDDGVGAKAAAALEAELSSQQLQVIAAHQLTPEMAEAVGRSSRVLFLDAAHTGVPGEIRCRRVLRDPEFQPGSGSHDLAPSVLLELAARYFHAQPEAWLLTITGDNFDLGKNLSPAIQAAWEAYLDRIRAWVCGV